MRTRRFASMLIAASILSIPSVGLAASGGSVGPDVVRFEENLGQFSHEVRFAASSSTTKLFVTEDHVVLVLAAPDAADGSPQSTAIKVKFVGPGVDVTEAPIAEDVLDGVRNYFIGKHGAIAGVPTFGTVRFPQIRPGVDAVIHGSGERRFEYLFEAAPGADLDGVGLRFKGATPVEIDEDGNVVIWTAAGEMKLAAPVAWQPGANGNTPVEVWYEIQNNSIRISHGYLDPERSLVVDPVLVFEQTVGGSSNDAALAVAVDAAGNSFIAGRSRSSNFPTTAGAYDGTISSFGGADDAFVMKRGPTGAVIWSTSLGGDFSADDEATAIVLDASNQPVIVGSTKSCYFASAPTPCSTTLPLPLVMSEPNAFLVKLNATGSAVLLARNFGGSGADIARGVAVESGSNMHIVGSTLSTNFPTAGRLFPSDPFPDYSANGGKDAFVVRMSSTGTMQRSGYLGGSNDDEATAVIVDATGRAHVAGTTVSSNFPITGGGYSNRGDATVTRFAADGRSLDLSFHAQNSAGTSANFEEKAVGIALGISGQLLVAGTQRQWSVLGYLQADSFLRIYPETSGFVAAPFETMVQTGGGTEEAVGIVSARTAPATISRYYFLSSVSTGGFTQLNPVDVYSGGRDFYLQVWTRQDAQTPILRHATYIGTVGDEVGGGLAVDGAFGATVAGATSTGSEDLYIARIQLTGAANSANATEDQQLNVSTSVLVNDSDLAGTSNTAVLATGPSQAASFALSPNGTYQYLGAADYFGPDSFSYQVSDGFSTSEPIGVAITVNNVNDAPRPQPDSVSTSEDTPLGIPTATLLANDLEVDGTELTVASVGSPSSGTVSLADGVVTYSPALNFSGTATFSYSATDGTTPVPVLVTVTVTPVDDPPAPQNDLASTTEETPVTIAASTLLANDLEVDGQSLQVVAVHSPSSGSVSLLSGVITYTPAADFAGTATFQYNATDGTTAPVAATVTITVTGQDDAPRPQNDVVAATEDVTLQISVGSLLANDVEVDGQSLTIVAVHSPSSGSVGLAGTVVSFLAGADFYGVATFVYEVTDGTMPPVSATVTVNVAGVDDAPRPQPDSVSGVEDQTLVLAASALIANDLEVDGQLLTVASVHSASIGSVGLVGTTISYVPPSDHFGPATFEYDVSDGTTTAVTALVTVSIASSNDAPIANADAYALPSSGTLVVSAPGVTANDTEVDSETLAAEVVVHPLYGALTFQPLGGFRYEAYREYPGVDSFQYRARDAAGSSSTATVTITGTPRHGDESTVTNENSSVTVDVMGNDPGLLTSAPPVTEVAFCYDGYDQACGGVDAPATPHAAGQRTRVADKPGSVSYSFDGAARLVSETRVLSVDASSYTTSTEHDALGNSVVVTHPTGVTIERVFDEISRETSVSTRVGAGPPTPLLLIGGGAQGEGWFPQGGLRAWRGASGSVAFEIEQNGAGWVTRMSATSVAAVEPNEILYAYANDGNVTSIGSGVSRGLTHDSLGRLTSDAGLAYTYDDAGNRLSGPDGAIVYPNPSNDRWSSASNGTLAYEFDLAGNVVQRGFTNLSVADDGTVISLADLNSRRHFLRDYRNLRLSLTGPGSSERFMFEPFGSLSSIFGEAFGEPCPNGLWRSVTPTETVVNVAGRRMALVIARAETACGGGTPDSTIVDRSMLYFADKMDLPTAVYREVDGVVEWSGDFDAFGNAVVLQEDPDGDSVSFEQRFRLPGQIHLGDGLSENWNRVYDSVVGRYLQPDPIHLPYVPQNGGYLYARDNPFTFIDPTGLVAQICCRNIAQSGAGSGSQGAMLALFGIKHCWLSTGDGTRYSWMPLDSEREAVINGGDHDWAAKRTNHPSDSPDTADTCRPCRGKCDEDASQCIRDAYKQYPEVGHYNFMKTNSNTFAGTIANKCCKGRIGPNATWGAWGWNSDPQPSVYGE